MLVDAPGVVGAGVWRGHADPVVDTRIDVELDVPHPVDWEEITVLTPGTAAPVPARDELAVSGTVEHCGDDLVVALRVADSIVLVETTGRPPTGIVGERVALLALGVGVYPTGV
ncbi:hypothetical protein [Cellulomonas sp.]|uniref:hypothetical protein n=1 Tax=Cellulomonas sp. TaxID=40001 RepID=UPI003BAAFA43